MKFSDDLIGKKIVRTKPCKERGGDASFMNDAIKVLEITNGLLYFKAAWFGDAVRSLDKHTWDDGNWEVWIGDTLTEQIRLSEAAK